MEEYNEVMRISWENGEEKWGFTPRQDEDEIEKLRKQNAELVEALIDMRNHINARDWDEDVSDETKATFAKATGGK